MPALLRTIPGTAHNLSMAACEQYYTIYLFQAPCIALFPEFRVARLPHISSGVARIPNATVSSANGCVHLLLENPPCQQ